MVRRRGDVVRRRQAAPLLHLQPIRTGLASQTEEKGALHLQLQWPVRESGNLLLLGRKLVERRIDSTGEQWHTAMAS
jgi:hypothetical protein